MQTHTKRNLMHTSKASSKIIVIDLQQCLVDSLFAEHVITRARIVSDKYKRFTKLAPEGKTIPIFRPIRLRTTPFDVAHTYKGDTREYTITPLPQDNFRGDGHGKWEKQE